MESHFGLYNVWAQGDWVTRGVALLLLGMSLATWMVILFKAMDLVRYKKLARQAETCLLYTSPSPRDRTRSRMPSSA